VLPYFDYSIASSLCASVDGLQHIPITSPTASTPCLKCPGVERYGCILPQFAAVAAGRRKSSHPIRGITRDFPCGSLQIGRHAMTTSLNANGKQLQTNLVIPPKHLIQPNDDSGRSRFGYAVLHPWTRYPPQSLTLSRKMGAPMCRSTSNRRDLLASDGRFNHQHSIIYANARTSRISAAVTYAGTTHLLGQASLTWYDLYGTITTALRTPTETRWQELV